MAMDNPPPPPPAKVEQPGKASRAPIADKRDAFARKTPQTQEDRDAAKAFIEGRIEMVRHDPHMTEAQKAEAIADLEARRDAIEREPGKERPK
jgi:hypothetical protein